MSWLLGVVGSKPHAAVILRIMYRAKLFPINSLSFFLAIFSDVEIRKAIHKFILHKNIKKA